MKFRSTHITKLLVLTLLTFSALGSGCLCMFGSSAMAATMDMRSESGSMRACERKSQTINSSVSTDTIQTNCCLAKSSNGNPAVVITENKINNSIIAIIFSTSAYEREAVISPSSHIINFSSPPPRLALRSVIKRE